MKFIEVDVDDANDVNDECYVHEVDVDDVCDVKDVGDDVRMIWEIDFGSSSLGKTLRRSFRE